MRFLVRMRRVSLRHRVSVPKVRIEDLESVSGAEEVAPQSSSTEGDSIADTVQALVALGYSNGEAYRAVHSVPEAEKLDAEQLLKEALKKVLTFL